jgi:hypothetical protein
VSSWALHQNSCKTLGPFIEDDIHFTVIASWMSVPLLRHCLGIADLLVALNFEPFFSFVRSILIEEAGEKSQAGVLG